MSSQAANMPKKSSAQIQSAAMAPFDFRSRVSFGSIAIVGGRSGLLISSGRKRVDEVVLLLKRNVDEKEMNVHGVVSARTFL
jgi:hypothetical protein